MLKQWGTELESDLTTIEGDGWETNKEKDNELEERRSGR